MSIGYFLDKNQQPSEAEVQTTLGMKYPLWERILQFIAGQYRMPGEWNFGGKKYGWNLWYRKSGKSLVSLYPQEEGFVAQVVLGREAADKALTLGLGEKVGAMVRETPRLHDGQWLFIPVTSEVDVQDVEQLLLVKKKPARK